MAKPCRKLLFPSLTILALAAPLAPAGAQTVPAQQALEMLPTANGTIARAADEQGKLYGSIELATRTLTQAFEKAGASEWATQMYASTWGGWLWSDWPGPFYSYHLRAISDSQAYAQTHDAVPADQLQAIAAGFEKWRGEDIEVRQLMTQKVENWAQEAKALSDGHAASLVECGKDDACRARQDAAVAAAQREYGRLDQVNDEISAKLRVAYDARFFSALQDNANRCTSMALAYAPAKLALNATAAGSLSYAPEDCDHAMGVPEYAIQGNEGGQFRLAPNGAVTLVADKAGTVTVKVTQGPLSASAAVAALNDCKGLTLAYDPAKLSLHDRASPALAYAPDGCDRPAGDPAFAISAEGAKFTIDAEGVVTREDDKLGSATVKVTHGALAASAIVAAANDCKTLTLAYKPETLALNATAQPTLAYEPQNCERPPGEPSFAVEASKGAKFQLAASGAVTLNEDKAGSVMVRARHGALAASATVTASPKLAAAGPNGAPKTDKPASDPSANPADDTQNGKGSGSPGGSKGGGSSGSGSGGSPKGGASSGGGSGGNPSSGGGSGGTPSGGGTAGGGKGGGTGPTASASGAPDPGKGSGTPGPTPGGGQKVGPCTSISLEFTPDPIHVATASDREEAKGVVRYSPDGCEHPSDSPVFRAADPKIVAPVASNPAAFTGLAPGNTTVTVTQGGLSADAPLSVAARSACQEMTLAYAAVEAKSADGRPRFAPTFGYAPAHCDAPQGPAAYQSSDAKVAAVDAGGIVTGLAKGHATITAKNGKLTANADVVVP